MPAAEDTDRAIILAWFLNFQEEDGDEESRSLHHPLRHRHRRSRRALDDAITAHYRLPDGTYDIERAANDLATYPPIAARIKELEAEKAEKERLG